MRSLLTGGRKAPYYVAIVVAAIALQIALLASLAPELARGGRFLVRDIGAETTISQRFEVADDGLFVIRVDADIAGDPGTGYLEASIFRLAPAAEQVGAARVPLRATSPACCEFVFNPIGSAPGETFRLDLAQRQASASVRFGIWARAAKQAGGLVLNGHRQPANLLLEGSGAPLLLPGDMGRLNPMLVVLGLAVIELSIVFALFQLLNHPAPQEGAPYST
jgi:hypothetical protein